MDLIEKARALEGVELGEFARMIFDDGSFEDVIVGLVRGGTVEDGEKIAEILSYMPVDGTEDRNIFVRANSQERSGRRYLDLFLKVCKSKGLHEREYIHVPVFSAYARRGGELAGWSDAVDDWLYKRAQDNFDAVAEGIENCDKKLYKYGVLIKADKNRAITLLLNKAVHGKGMERSAAREALMSYPEIADSLFLLYENSDAHGRVSVVRALKAIKNDARVRSFLSDVAAKDKSKTVRDVANSVSGTCRRADAVGFFENMMTSGRGIELCELKRLTAGGSGSEKKRRHGGYADVADRLLFYVRKAEPQVLLFNDGAFFDTEDRPVKLKPHDLIYVLHPLDESGEILDSLEVEQPFPQAGRKIFYPLPGERYSSVRFNGTVVSAADFDAAFKRSGFIPVDDGDVMLAVAIIGDYAVAAECDVDSGVSVGCGVITYYRSSDLVRSGRNLFVASAPALDIASMPLKAYSELTYSVAKLFGCL